MASRAATTTAPPYPSAARISDSQCFPQYTASLKWYVATCVEIARDHGETSTLLLGYHFMLTDNGLEEFNSDKSKCQEHFDVYKECKKKEREARLERNRSRSFFS
ncbi:hypothetical protein JRO89_XS01G0005800 [Xanthoceras sorbifolium]|uniref:Uncharacterized protein n=1 Tax=Xanthoceras sorbifolium TaxID=99658 RepID=A0ABQ8IHK8_9ROSI|nr:hypothetical protein JRO89_XS01G0005800 [Xanthoceras sorbifolium]